MSYATIILVQIAQMFVLMAVGTVLFRFRRMGTDGAKDFGSLLVNVVIPVVIVRSLWTDRTQETTEALVSTFILALGLLVLALVVSRSVFREDGLLAFATAFSNAGFVGIPLVEAALGEQAVIYIVCLIGWLNVLQCTVGVLMISGDRTFVSPRSVLTSPIVISFGLGLALYFIGLPEPSLLSDLFSTVAALNTPVAMIVSGSYLAQVRVHDLVENRGAWMVCILRLLIIPALSLVFLAILPWGHGTAGLALLIASSAPVGANVAIYAHQCDGDYRTAVITVCSTTLLSIITLPLVIAVGSSVLLT